MILLIAFLLHSYICHFSTLKLVCVFLLKTTPPLPSAPLTIVHALETLFGDTGEPPKQLDENSAPPVSHVPSLDILTVHVLGAEYDMECDGIEQWMIILHELPQVMFV